jgi:hypothetical protein
MSITRFWRKMEAPRAETTAERQGSIGRPVQDGTDGRQHPHDHDGHQENADHGTIELGQSQGGQNGQPQVGADGEQVPVSEIDELEHPVHHGVAQGDQGIDPSHGEPVGKLLKKLLHDRSVPAPAAIPMAGARVFAPRFAAPESGEQKGLFAALTAAPPNPSFVP